MPELEVKDGKIDLSGVLDEFKNTFKTEILTEMNTSINGAIKSTKTEIGSMFEDLKKTFKAPDKKDDPPVGGDPKTIAELNSKLVTYESSMKTIQDKLTQAEQDREQAQKDARESNRVSKFDSEVATFQFASDKAREQFRRSYLSLVEYDEAGNLIVKSDKGPMDMKGFLTNEYKESTHLQPATNRGGAGAGGGQGAGKGGEMDFADNMSPAQIAALPKEQQAAYRQQVSAAFAATQRGG